MTYFLDFDRTLMNNEAFFEYVLTLPEWEHFHPRVTAYKRRSDGTSAFTADEREQMYNEIDAWVASGGYSFSKGELTQFLYPDVVSFLDSHPNQCVVVTCGHNTLEFQRSKLVSSGVSERVLRVVFVQDAEQSKGPVFSELVTEYAGPHVFVDDKESQLDAVRTTTPTVQLFHMVRDYATAPSDRYDIVRTLTELP